MGNPLGGTSGAPGTLRVGQPRGRYTSGQITMHSMSAGSRRDGSGRAATRSVRPASEPRDADLVTED